MMSNEHGPAETGPDDEKQGTNPFENEDLKPEHRDIDANIPAMTPGATTRMSKPPSWWNRESTSMNDTPHRPQRPQRAEATRSGFEAGATRGIDCAGHGCRQGHPRTDLPPR
ncbi:hypothetical protein [Brevibacterium sp. UCMA 11754]|uniref:hypothetical protein n=1 Tax=Brevibacterium sp. UCMA 11754 TaxID=2749198 RepID=UPI001F4643A3|nr:hypothetical protein [Brevibacterium sp. UCMA 11754]